MAVLTLLALMSGVSLAGAATSRAGGQSGGSGGGGLQPPGTTISTPVASVTVVSTPSSPPAPYAPPPVTPPRTRTNPFAGRGMWIWVLGSSDGGNFDALVSDARRYGIGTLFIKSADGASMWSQFTPGLVSGLHSAHLRVCAWQYVYGADPLGEAAVAARAVHDGADCLVIDAESEYQGRYVQAQKYLGRLRSLVGARYPLALAGFPYVDYHPAFPYSVFLGFNGVQFNAPQMYWKAIGTTVAAVYAHTYAFNEIYGRPIAPLGQLYDDPPSPQVREFRSISRLYHAAGLSWWDWQSARTVDFRAISQPAGPAGNVTPDTEPASLGSGAKGDAVVWAQEQLDSAGARLSIDGDFGPLTQSAVESFQSQHGLTVSGVVDPPTWSALLRYPPLKVRWVQTKKQGAHAVPARAGTRGGPVVAAVPASADLPERGDELAGAGGRGRPHGRR